jgi:hypothetical protein
MQAGPPPFGQAEAYPTNVFAVVGHASACHPGDSPAGVRHPCRGRTIKSPRLEAVPNLGLASVALLRESSRGQAPNAWRKNYDDVRFPDIFPRGVLQFLPSGRQDLHFSLVGATVAASIGSIGSGTLPVVWRRLRKRPAFRSVCCPLRCSATSRRYRLGDRASLRSTPILSVGIASPRNCRGAGL